MTSYEKRIERLERRSSWVIALNGLLLSVLLLAWTNDRPDARDVLQAELFQLVDGQGTVHGELRMNAEGPALVLFDDEGNPRVDLFHDREATALYLKDEDGQPRVGSAYFAHGGGGFALHGPDGGGTSVLYMQGAGPGRLSYYDSTGTEIHRYPPRN